MLALYIVVRVADDKDFLSPIFECLGRLKKEDITVSFTIIGQVYDEGVYSRLVSLSQHLKIADLVHFTRQSVSYAKLDEKTKQGYFLNYSQDDVVGYSTMEAMTMGLKTILFNCHPDIHESRPGQVSFCNNTEDLYRLLKALSINEADTRESILGENISFANSFFLNPKEQELLLQLF